MPFSVPGVPRPFVLLALGVVVLATTALAADAPAPRRQGAGGKRAQGAAQWWKEIDTGPFISDTFLDAPGGEVVALKGIAIKLGAARDVSVVFDTELLCWRAGFDGVVELD